MAWVKRNLGLVIGGVIALALLGVAGWYLWAKIQEDQEVTQQLDDTTQKFQTLLQRPVHPGTENGKINNIEIAKEEVKRLQAFLQDVRSRFGTRDIPTNISNRDFRALLDNTVNELQKNADSLGISLPQKDYWFTFAPQRTQVEFKAVGMLTQQLMDVKELCEILYAAKVQDVKGIRRVPSSSDENNTTDFMTDKKASTNEFAIVTPYELRFQGFSSELARVMEQLVNAKDCYIIKSVAVDKAPADEVQQAAPMYVDPRQAYRSRYGAYMPQTMPQAQARRPSNVLLDESKLLIVMEVDSVRLKEQAGAKKAAAKQVAQQ
jgi:hypothetical protein